VDALFDLALEHHLDTVVFLLLAVLGTACTLRFVRRPGERGGPWRATAMAMIAATVFAVPATEVADGRERERLKAMLAGFAPTYALGLEHAGYASFSLQTAADDPLYLRLVEWEKSWLEVNPHAHDIYTFHLLDDGKVVLGVDSETDYDRDGAFLGEREQRTPIGEDYDVDPGELANLQRVMAGEQLFQPDIYSDRWGTWVSAFAPIHDPSGRTIAVLGVDYDARSWVRAIAVQRCTVLGTFAVLLLLIGGGVVLFESNRSQATRRMLAEHNQRLELANQDLQRASERASAANAAKTQFLANMSHELRTPLTAILGFADLLLEGGAEDPQWREHAETIRRSGQHLLSIVGDVLDLAKTEAGVLEVHPVACSPRGIAGEVVAMLAPAAARKGLELRCEVAATVPESFTTDPDRLRQILVNLIGNAVKFTERGHVIVRLVLGPLGDQVHFLVVDTGAGIAGEQQSRLFQPFSQVDATLRRRHGGTGLGLAISRRFAKLLGGDLSLASEVGQGSTFRLALPCERLASPNERQEAPAVVAPHAPMATTAPGAGSAAANLRGRVLLAEDGPDNQRLLTHVLRKFGLEVEVVGNGRLAFERMVLGAGSEGSRPPIDLVLMDMQMPELDGYEATRRLRGIGCRVPIVAVTAHATSDDRDRCVAAGCDDYVSKPVDRKRLNETLRRWLMPPA